MPPILMLGPYHEVAGRVIRLEERDGALFAEIGKHIVVLPLELKGTISPHLGNRISALKTDISGLEYLIRVIPDPRADIDQTAQARCDSERISEEV